MTERVDHRAWQVVASFFVTGEDASYTTVTPKSHLDPKNGTVGAIEVVARYGELRIDGDTFGWQFADPRGPPEARAPGAWESTGTWRATSN